MEDEYNIDPQDSTMSELNRSDVNEIADTSKEFGEAGGYDESYEDEEGGNNFRGRGGRGNFRGRGRGPPPGWMNGPPPMRFRGRGYGPGGPPMRGRGFFRGRGGPRYGPNNGPNYDNNWGPMGPPPPGMMGGPPPFGPPPGMMPPGGPMGPPPNMMGQPPPFGPPGMPPPNMPAPELWVETKSDEGKSYYYHARTRETTWTRPQESPTCKVITQAEVDVMTAAGQYPGMGQSMPMNGPMGGPPMGGPPMGMMPNGMMGMMPPGVGPHGPTPGSVPPFMNQPPPWVKDNHQMQSKMDSQESSPDDDAPPGEAPVQPTQPPGTGPGTGAGWGWGWAPPMVAQPPGLAAVPDAGAATQPQTGTPAAITEALPTDSASTPKKEETVIPPELSARASEWTTHRAPDGRPYYYHAASSQSVWEKPQPLKEFDDLQNKIAKEKGEKIDNKKDKRIIDDGKIEVIDVEAHAEAVAAAEAAAEAAERERVERERMERERAEKERAEKERVEKEKLEKEKAKTDKSRPVSSTPISGTPWCVVWTGDGRVFFYNPTARLSVWERPAQLAGRTDVDQAVAHPPHQRDQQRKETPTVATTPTKSSNGELKRGASDTSDSDSEPAKKAKQEEAKKKPAPPPGVIDMGKEAAMEAEARAARERALVPFEQRVRAFLQMLHESDVSAFSPWEKELHKIVFDSRYLLLESKERKQVFDKYVRERAEEERKEKKNRIQQKKLAFRAVMEEAKLHSKSSFTEFSGKFSRDERFKSIEKMRDRETYFNEYIAEVRKKEKEEKDRKRELAKTEFITLLKEKSVDRHSRWLEVKKKIDSDARYKAVESSTMREDYFREYCKMVKEERKKEKDGKEKERERGSKKDKKDKDRDKEKEREKETKKDKKKEKTGDKQLDASTEDEKKQPTPPPDQWADILGIPGEEEEKESKTNPKTKEKKEELDVEKEETKSPSPEKEMLSPKQLRSSKKELPTEKKSPIKSPPKKRKQDFKSPEPETEKKGKKKADKAEKPEKAEKTEKTEKRRRKKSEKEYVIPHFLRYNNANSHFPLPSRTSHGTASPSRTFHGTVSSSRTSYGTALPSRTSHGTATPSRTSHGTVSSSRTSHGTASPFRTFHGTVSSSRTSYGTALPSRTSHGTATPSRTSHGTVSSSRTSHGTASPFRTFHGTVSSSRTSYGTALPSRTSHGTASPSRISHGTALPSRTSHGRTEEAVSAPEGGPPCEEAKARAARAQASIKERERQVQRALATSLRDRDKEREYHKRDEAVQHFNALLADLVRNPDLTWREAKKQLKKDHRYSLAEELSKDDKERLFGQHIGVVSTKRRDKLRAVLSELGVGGAAAWRDVKERLREHPAAPQYKNAPQMEREFRDYQRDKQSNAKTALRQLLLETRAITHRSLAAVKEAPHALTALHDTLKHDARYIALEHIPEEREAIITSYLEELDKKGPPPPPTATEPSRRAKQ